MKTIFVIGLLLVAGAANAATAFFTGRQEMITTVTYQSAYNCEYDYLGRKFWRAFKGSCPMSVEVQ